MLAAAYGQSPDYFDHWPAARVQREIEIYAELVGTGDNPLTATALVGILESAGILERS